ncbi:MAG: ABC transporter permease subunit [Pseudomonadales bacterium]|nr:ABC transporter permease subunit [Pseudomonadales bacterium]|tara:strand:- start:5701 stop:6615 length:915 start_codon:yes stop_codon:yes gene_type:complete
MKNTYSEITDRAWELFVVYLPYLWLVLFFLAPFLIVFKISFADPIIAQPPFTPLFDWARSGTSALYITFDNFLFLFEDDLYWLSYVKSLKVAAISTLCCLFLGYPMAYAITRADTTTRNILLLLIILPFWTSFLLRVYAWMGMLSTHGLINKGLLWMGFIDAPIKLLYTDFAVYLGIVYTYLPFMILPLYAALQKLDLSMHEAASDLGATPFRVFIDITLPLSASGIIAGCLLVFIPAIGEYVIPALLGGPDSLMIGRQLFNEFFENRDWPVASAVATILLFILVIPIMLFQRFQITSETNGGE